MAVFGNLEMDSVWMTMLQNIASNRAHEKVLLTLRTFLSYELTKRAWKIIRGQKSILRNSQIGSEKIIKVENVFPLAIFNAPFLKRVSSQTKLDSIMQTKSKVPKDVFVRTTLAKSRRVSKSSNILLFFVVSNTIKSFSIAWYTYRTLSVSTNVCCFPDVINLGNADRRPSIRDLVISTNCRETSTDDKQKCNVKIKR